MMSIAFVTLPAAPAAGTEDIGSESGDTGYQLGTGPYFSDDVAEYLNRHHPEKPTGECYSVTGSLRNACPGDARIITVNVIPALSVQQNKDAVFLYRQPWRMLVRKSLVDTQDDAQLKTEIARIIVPTQGIADTLKGEFPGSEFVIIRDFITAVKSFRSGAANAIVTEAVTAQLLLNLDAYKDVFSLLPEFQFFSYVYLSYSENEPGVDRFIRKMIAGEASDYFLLMSDKNRAIALNTLLNSEWSAFPTTLIASCVVIIVLVLLMLYRESRLRLSTRILLSRSVQFWETLINSVPTPTLVCSPSGIITHCNRALLESLQISREQITGQPLTLLNRRWSMSPAVDTGLLVSAISSGKPIFTECSMWIGGKQVDFVQWFSIYDDIGGRPAGVIVGWTDISKRKTLEVALEASKKHAEKVSEEKSLFLARMSHEIRSPLNVIIGILEIESCKAVVSGKSLEIASGAASQLMHLIGDILDLSKIEAGELSLRNGIADLHQLMNELSMQYTFLAHNKNLSFYCDVEKVEGRFYFCDASKIKQILNNLLSNAVKFTQAGDIHFSVNVRSHSQTSDDVIFRVEDTGTGIEASRTEDVFSAYHQIDPTAPRSTGLGLYITKELVKKMEGEITLTSVPGVGTAFEVCLPLPLAAPQTAVPEEHFQSGLRCRILIVDDSEANLSVLEMQLNTLGHQVIKARNGNEGFEMAMKDNHIEFIITDCQMPVMDGYTFARKVRQRMQKTHPFVIGTTASAFTDEESRCCEAGMDHVLIKPLKLADINRMLEQTHFSYQVDLDEILLMTGNNVSVYSKMIDEILTGTQREISVIEQLSLSGDYDGVSRSVHKLKGTFSLAGFNAGVFLCERFENDPDSRLRMPLMVCKLKNINGHFRRLVTNFKAPAL